MSQNRRVAIISLFIILFTLGLIITLWPRGGRILQPKPPIFVVQAVGELPQGDALVAPPPEPKPGLTIQALPFSSPQSPYAAGSVAVGIILPSCEPSQGVCSEQWDDPRVAQVVSKVQSGLKNFWAQVYPEAKVSFVTEDHLIGTSYEPITLDLNTQCNWINEIMPKLGADSSLSCFDKVRHYNEILRQRHGTDWAFTIFIPDSLHDADGKFADGRFAYSYIGGPFSVVTYKNDGWGPGNMDLVVAHEAGHTFGAPDQYSGPRCDLTSGYAKYGPFPESTQNVDGVTQPGCRPQPEPGVMAMSAGFFENRLVSSSTRCQVGWCDSGKWNGTWTAGQDRWPDPFGSPEIRVTDRGSQITVWAEIHPLPVSGTTQVHINSIIALKIVGEGGTIISQEQMEPATNQISFIRDVDPLIKDLRVCLIPRLGSEFCTIVRAETHVVFLPIVLK